MTRIYISDIGKYLGQSVTLKGWLYNKRSSGKLVFLQLRDGSGIIQCVVFKGDVSEEKFKLA
ncbi:MAG: asparagine--tRNA ligase, partial [Elusimicrobiota bacterium]|nr:asparagine--tRNA ligase [Elusimicrobiota bacterium]